MNVLVNLVCDNTEVVLVEEKQGGQKIPALALQAKGLVTNLWSSTSCSHPFFRVSSLARLVTFGCVESKSDIWFRFGCRRPRC